MVTYTYHFVLDGIDADAKAQLDKDLMFRLRSYKRDGKLTDATVDSDELIDGVPVGEKELYELPIDGQPNRFVP